MLENSINYFKMNFLKTGIFKYKHLFFFVPVFVVCAIVFLPKISHSDEILGEKIIAKPTAFIGDWSNTQSLKQTDLSPTAGLELFDPVNSSFPNLQTKDSPEPVADPVQESMPADLPVTASSESAAEVPEPVEKTVPATEFVPADEPVIVSPPVPVEASPLVPEATPPAETSWLFDRTEGVFKYFKVSIAAAKEKDDIAQSIEQAEIIMTDAIPLESENKTDSKSIPEEIVQVDQKKDDKNIEKEEKKEEKEVSEQDKSQLRSESIDISLVAGQFDIEPTAQTLSEDEKIENVRLGVSMANSEFLSDKLILYYLDNNDWKKLVNMPLIPHSNELNNGYYYFSLPSVKKLQDLKKIQIKLVYNNSASDLNKQLLLDSLWIEADPVSKQILQVVTSSPVSLISNKNSFEMDEDVMMVFHYEKNSTSSVENGIIQTITDVLGITDSTLSLDLSKNTEIKILDKNNIPQNGIETDILYLTDNNFAVTIPKKEQGIKPGEYKLVISVYSNDNEVVNYEQTFAWGVLAINTNKFIYKLNESAFIQMAALDSEGHTLCSANLALSVTDSAGNSVPLDIQKSAECGPETVTQKPDYSASYLPTSAGTYSLTLKNIDNGNEVSDFFEVKNTEQPFVIERLGPTRIYPLAQYQMTVDIIVNENFEGTITENIPTGFVVNDVQLQKIFASNSSSISAVSTTVESHFQVLSADVSWFKDDHYKLTYNFDAPDISPYLFLMGPIKFISDNTIYYEEGRKWQIASDALSIIEPNGDGTIGCAATPNGSNFSTVADAIDQPSVPNVSNYVTCAIETSDSYDMSTITNVSSTSQIQVWVYYKNNNVSSNFEFELWDAAETTQYGTTQVLANSASDSWGNITFSALALSQAQLDNLKLKVINTGSGGANSILYSLYAIVEFTTASQAPEISSILLNNNSDIILTANTSTSVVATANITNATGYSNIDTVIAKFYRSGVAGGDACTADDNNCYQTNCTLGNCADNSCVATCQIDMQFFAEPTDAGTPWESNYWRVWMRAEDVYSQSGEGFSQSGAVELQSLAGLMLEGADIVFGQLSPGQATDPLTSSVKISSVGNTAIDLYVSGEDMINVAYPSSTINVNNIRFATNSFFSYSSSTELAVSPGVSVDLDFSKPVSIGTVPSSTLWWGIKAPIPTMAGSYQSNIIYSGSVKSLPW